MAQPKTLEEMTPFRHRAENGPLAFEATVEGKLPTWLKGNLIRTAPAIFDRAPHKSGAAFRADHWFDGLGLLYRFRLGDGRVQFRQCLMESVVEKQAREGKMGRATFATPMVRGFWRRLFAPIPAITDNTNVNLYGLGEDCVAVTEAPHQWAFDPESLALTRCIEYRDDLGVLPMIAHPHLEPGRDRLVNVANKIGRTSEIIVYEHGLRERARRVVAKIPVKRFPYVHSFGLTPRSVVLVGQPYDFSPLKSLWSNRGYIDHFEYRPQAGTTLWVIERQTGKVRTHAAPAGFTFHVINAYETGDSTVVDLTLYPDPSIVDALRRKALLENGYPNIAPSAVRWVLTPGREQARVERIVDNGFELPAIHPSKDGQRHRVCWGTRFIGAASHQSPQSILVRLEESGKTIEHHDPSVLFGEAVFIPRPGAERDDDGVLLTVGSENAQDRSELRVHDPRTLEVMARAFVPLPLPLGFHGAFFAEA